MKLFPVPGGAILRIFDRYLKVSQAVADMIGELPELLLTQLAAQFNQQIDEGGSLLVFCFRARRCSTQ